MTAAPLIGAGYRAELPDVFGGDDGPAVDVAELIADRYFAEQGFNRPWELRLLKERGIPVTLHGLCGNAASVVGPTPEYLQQIRKLADEMDALCYTDHLAFTETSDRSLGHLAPNRFDDELLEQVADNIDRMVSITGRRPRLENLATTIQIPGSTYTVEEFYLALLEASDQWDCLLDITNLWINSQNRPVDPVAIIDAIPPERLRYVHLAGGTKSHDEWVDSHSQPVHEEVFPLLAHLLSRALPDVIMVERDDDWTGAEEQVKADIERVRKLVAASPLLLV